MVEKFKLEVELAKEVYEVGRCFEQMVKAYKTASADGFQAVQDVPAILLASLSDMMKAMEGVQKVAEAFKESPVGASKAVLLPVLDGIELLLQK